MISVYLTNNYKIQINKHKQINFSATFTAETLIEYKDFDIKNRQDFLSMLAANELFLESQLNRLGAVRADWSSINDDYYHVLCHVSDDDNSTFTDYYIRVSHTGKKHLRYVATVSLSEYGDIVASYNFTNQDIDQTHTLNILKEIAVSNVDF